MRLYVNINGCGGEETEAVVKAAELDYVTRQTKKKKEVGRERDELLKQEELLKTKQKDVKMGSGSNDQRMLNSAFGWRRSVTTATVHSTVIIHTGETCLPTGDLEDHNNHSIKCLLHVS